MTVQMQTVLCAFPMQTIPSTDQAAWCFMPPIAFCGMPGVPVQIARAEGNVACPEGVGRSSTFSSTSTSHAGEGDWWRQSSTATEGDHTHTTLDSEDFSRASMPESAASEAEEEDEGAVLSEEESERGDSQSVHGESTSAVGSGETDEAARLTVKNTFIHIEEKGGSAPAEQAVLCRSGRRLASAPGRLAEIKPIQ